MGIKQLHFSVSLQLKDSADINDILCLIINKSIWKDQYLTGELW